MKRITLGGRIFGIFIQVCSIGIWLKHKSVVPPAFITRRKWLGFKKKIEATSFQVSFVNVPWFGSVDAGHR